MAAQPPRAARLSLRAVFSAQKGRAAARRERASLFVEPAVSEVSENRYAAPLPAGVSAAWGMRCLRQDGQTCQAQRSHPQFPIGQDRLKRMRRGYGADEKIKDVMGQLLAVVAHSAGIQDGAGARALPIRLFMRFERGPFCGWQLHGQSPGRGPRASSAPASPALALPVSGMRPSQATGRCFRSRLPSGERHQKQEQI